MIPIFSIIVPCFNSSKTLKKALESILEQDFNDYEIVVINDGSTDDTQKILDSYLTNLKFKIIHQSNKGLGAARNEGIKIAVGEYICFLDSDDYWYPSKLQEVKKVFDDFNVDLVCHDEFKVVGDQVLNVLKYGPYTSYEDLLFKGNCLSPSAVSVRKSILDLANGFSTTPQIHGVEDYDLWMRLAKNGARFHYLHKPLGVFFIHSKNMSSSLDYRDREDFVLQTHFEKLEMSDPHIDRLVKKRKAIQLAARGWEQINTGNFELGIRFYSDAFKLDPISRKLWKYVLLGSPYLIFKTIKDKKIYE
jgi:teichuronic acid biosynthesis glycosyltransferase TuaG